MTEHTNDYDLMRAAMRDAKHTMMAADSVANTMADMLVGRLRKVDKSTLVALKKELQGFNCHTKRWDSR